MLHILWQDISESSIKTSKVGPNRRWPYDVLFEWDVIICLGPHHVLMTSLWSCDPDQLHVFAHCCRAGTRLRAYRFASKMHTSPLFRPHMNRGIKMPFLCVSARVNRTFSLMLIDFLKTTVKTFALNTENCMNWCLSASDPGNYPWISSYFIQSDTSHCISLSLKFFKLSM